MLTVQNVVTIQLKHLLGYNLLWNSQTHEVHYTGSNCRGSHHLDSMVLSHMHFFAGYYAWNGMHGQLYIVKWDPETRPYFASNRLSYSNCGHCHPDWAARRSA